jgi:hypothetical protein
LKWFGYWLAVVDALGTTEVADASTVDSESA